MQHLLMGMNTHINIDLGIAAAETSAGSAIEDLKADFMKVNDILSGLTNEMQSRVGRISFWMFLASWAGANKDDAVINFSMTKAREASWLFACQLAGSDDAERQIKTDGTDLIIAALAEIIKRPPGRILRNVLKFIAKFEEKDVKKIIAGLEQS
jgi:hypothetical protein